MTGAQLIVRAYDVIVLLIVARLLTPEDFGLVTIALSIMVIVNAVTEVPIVESLVRAEELTEGDIRSAFTLGLLRGTAVTIALVGLSYPVSALFRDERLIHILQMLAIGPLLQGLASPRLVFELRRVNYNAVAASQLAGKTASFIAILITAWLTRSYWALVAGLILNSLVQTFATHVLVPFMPKFSFHGMRKIFAFAGWITLSRIFFTLNQQADRLFVGGILGNARLGQYSMAGDLSSIATYSLATPVMQPLFAGLANLQSEPARLALAYIRGQQVMFALIAPVGFLFAVLAEPFVALVLGPSWASIPPIIWWLAPSISLQLLAMPTQSLFMATGRTRQLLVREILSMSLRFPATLFAAWALGLTAAAAARSIVGLVMTLYMLSAASSVIGVSVGRQILGCSRTLLALTLMCAIVATMDAAIIRQDSAVLQSLELLCLCAAGILSYVAAHCALWYIAGRPDGPESWLIIQIQRWLGR